MTSTLSKAIAGLCSSEYPVRSAAALEVYRAGRVPADRAVYSWWRDADFSRVLLGPSPIVTVGLAVERETFAKIRAANGTPRLASVPPDQDAEEFELHFPDGISLDILTAREPEGSGAIARYLTKFGEGVQQVEFQCLDVDRATSILKEKFNVTPIYPATRGGADGTRVNFFLVPSPDAGKVLIEFYEAASKPSPSAPSGH